MTGEGERPGVVILGATSALARAIALEAGRDGFAVALAGRDAEECETLAADVRVRTGAPCAAVRFDALEFDRHDALLAACEDALGKPPDGAVVCFGYMTDQAETEKDFAAARRTIDVNYTAAASVLMRFAAALERRGAGFLGVVTSVAGDRGRMSNYTYGSAKAGLIAFAQGLRNRLHHAGVTVTTLKPGFMDTKMTYGLLKPGPLLASPEAAGRACWRAVRRGKSVAYVPWFWRGVMTLIRLLPECVFKRMKM